MINIIINRLICIITFIFLIFVSIEYGFCEKIVSLKQKSGLIIEILKENNIYYFNFKNLKKNINDENFLYWFNYYINSKETVYNVDEYLLFENFIKDKLLNFKNIKNLKIFKTKENCYEFKN